MSFEENRQFWEEFIEIYRQHSCLWEVKSKIYHNRNLRNKAYEELIEKCKEIKPDADKKYVLKKINSLRASFRRQFRKISEGMTTGAGAEDVPEPSLWYYDLMLFTLDHEEVRLGTSSRISVNIAEDDINEETDTNEEIYESEVACSPLQNSSESSVYTPQQTNTVRKRSGGKNKTSWVKKRHELADAVTRFMKNDAPEDSATVFGKSVGLELALVKDTEQSDVAKKLISDVIFLAKRGQLTCNSRIEEPLAHPLQHFPHSFPGQFPSATRVENQYPSQSSNNQYPSKSSNTETSNCYIPPSTNSSENNFRPNQHPSQCLFTASPNNFPLQ